MRASGRSEGPRIAPVPTDEAATFAWSPLARESISRWGEDGVPNEHVRILLHNPERCDWFLSSSAQASRCSPIPARAAQLITLRAAHLTGCEFSWVEHVARGATSGLVDDDYEAVRQPLQKTKWPPLEHALLSAVDGYRTAVAVDDDTWADLQEHLTEAEIVWVLMKIAWTFQAMFMINSLRPAIAQDRRHLMMDSDVR